MRSVMCRRCFTERLLRVERGKAAQSLVEQLPVVELINTLENGNAESNFYSIRWEEVPP